MRLPERFDWFQGAAGFFTSAPRFRRLVPVFAHMAKEFSRKQRVASQIQKELATLIQQDLKDPRLGMVTVSDVEIAADLRNAKVYVTVFANTCAVPEVLQILNNAAGFLRHALAQRIELRVSPVLLFVYDVSVERGAALNALINDAVAPPRKPPQK